MGSEAGNSQGPLAAAPGQRCVTAFVMRGPRRAGVCSSNGGCPATAGRSPSGSGDGQAARAATVGERQWWAAGAPGWADVAPLRCTSHPIDGVRSRHKGCAAGQRRVGGRGVLCGAGPGCAGRVAATIVLSPGTASAPNRPAGEVGRKSPDGRENLLIVAGPSDTAAAAGQLGLPPTCSAPSSELSSRHRPAERGARAQHRVRDRARVLKIRGKAPCQRQLEGPGFVFAPELVMSNPAASTRSARAAPHAGRQRPGVRLDAIIGRAVMRGGERGRLRGQAGCARPAGRRGGCGRGCARRDVGRGGVWTERVCGGPRRAAACAAERGRGGPGERVGAAGCAARRGGGGRRCGAPTSG